MGREPEGSRLGTTYICRDTQLMASRHRMNAPARLETPPTPAVQAHHAQPAGAQGTAPEPSPTRPPAANPRSAASNPRERGAFYLIVGLLFALAMNALIGARLLLREEPLEAENVELPAEFKSAVREWLRNGGEVPPQRQVDARFALQAAQAVGQEALQTLDELIVTARAWEADIAPLTGDEDGRRIAASEERVEAYLALLAQRPDGERASLLRQEVQRLLLAAESEWLAEQATVTYGQAEATITALRAANAEARELLATAQQARQAILDLVDPSAPPAEQDLAAAVEQVRKRWRDEHAAALRQSQDAVRRAAALRGTNEVLKQGGLDQLKKEAVSPRVLAVVKPFITPSKLLGEQVYSTPRRFALSELRRTNALDRSDHGYARLAWSAVATDLHPNPWKSLLVNNRVQVDRWSPAQREFVRQAQDYLIKYGPSLVELGLLEP